MSDRDIRSTVTRGGAIASFAGAGPRPLQSGVPMPENPRRYGNEPHPSKHGPSLSRLAPSARGPSRISIAPTSHPISAARLLPHTPIHMAQTHSARRTTIPKKIAPGHPGDTRLAQLQPYRPRLVGKQLMKSCQKEPSMLLDRLKAPLLPTMLRHRFGRRESSERIASAIEIPLPRIGKRLRLPSRRKGKLPTLWGRLKAPPYSK